MRTLRLKILRGVALPGGINALPGEGHEVEERFGRALLFEGRAIPDPDILAPSGEEPQDDAGPDLDPEPPPAPASSQDRDPKPINRDPARRRQGPRR